MTLGISCSLLVSMIFSTISQNSSDSALFFLYHCTVSSFENRSCCILAERVAHSRTFLCWHCCKDWHLIGNLFLISDDWGIKILCVELKEKYLIVLQVTLWSKYDCFLNSNEPLKATIAFVNNKALGCE